MSDETQAVAHSIYEVKTSSFTQDRDCSVYVDLIISPAVQIGSGLADFLYGDGGRGEMELNTLYQAPGGQYTHVELRTAPGAGRLALELVVMLERLRMYLNEVDKSDPEQVKRMRYLFPVDKEAEHRHSQQKAS